MNQEYSDACMASCLVAPMAAKAPAKPKKVMIANSSILSAPEGCFTCRAIAVMSVAIFQAEHVSCLVFTQVAGHK